MSLEKKAIFLLFLPKFHKKYDMLDIKVWNFLYRIFFAGKSMKHDITPLTELGEEVLHFITVCM
jgi:Na+/glutamate symporter